MELNFSEKFVKLYEEKDTKKKIKLTSKHDLDSSTSDRKFHVDCKLTRKKICSCNSNISNLGSGKCDQTLNSHSKYDLTDFLMSLIHDEVKVGKDESTNKIKFVKENEECEKYYKMRKSLHLERIKNCDFAKTQTFLKNVDENKLLSYSDYREVEKSINDDKKICENCKTNIYDNNYHKGWKNEAGEHVLLCPICSKKYFTGALEMRFEKKEEMVIFNRSSSNSGIGANNQIYISNQTTNSSNSNLSTSKPVEDANLGMKRSSEVASELVCSNKRCNKWGKKSDFLCCADCEKYYHPQCTEPPVVPKLATRFKWLCSSCKVCQTCGVNKEEKLTRCSTCDRTFHPSCSQITTSPMNNKSYCKDCITCKNCAKILPIINSSNQESFVSIKGHRVCDDCWKYYKNKHYCPKCLKIYKQEEFQNTKVYCNKCLNWYHSECENVNPEEMKEKNKTKYSYTCSICRIN